MSKNINPPAFPMQAHADPVYGVWIAGHEGMSLRDYFAGQALMGSLACWDTKDNERFAFHKSDKERAAYLAKMSYFMADAMLEARANLSQSETGHG